MEDGNSIDIQYVALDVCIWLLIARDSILWAWIINKNPC